MHEIDEVQHVAVEADELRCPIVVVFVMPIKLVIVGVVKGA